MVADYCEAVIVTPSPDEIIADCKEFSQKNKVNISAELHEGTVILKSHGISAHGSTPELGVNAILHILAFLNTCGLEGDTADFIKSINNYIGTETTGQSLGIAFTDEPSGALSLNTVIIRMQRDIITLTCNVRFPVTVQFDKIIALLEQKTKKIGLEMVCDEHSDPLYFPKDHQLITTLHHIFVEQSGIKADSIAIGGGTYATEIPNIVAFGPEFPKTESCVHKPNEFIPINDLMLCAKIYGLAIYELAK